MSAILVYVAFKEQVKANENQEKINIRQEEINKENDAEKVSNYIESQISKLELFLLEDKFKFSKLASTLNAKETLFSENNDNKLEYKLEFSSFSNIIFFQLMFLSIIEELKSSNGNNNKYHSQKNKLDILNLLIGSTDYNQIILVLIVLKKNDVQLLSNTRATEDLIVDTSNSIKHAIENL